MSEYEYYNLTGDEILKLFFTLPEGNGIILLHKGCDVCQIDDGEFFDVLSKGWSVVI